jgi:hypothetical protein
MFNNHECIVLRMEYEFSFTAFFIGLVIVIVGIIFMRFYREICGFLGGGTSGYDRYRLAALIMCCFGVLVSLNLPIFILSHLLTGIFPSSVK